jgi:hypothetical protein
MQLADQSTLQTDEHIPQQTQFVPTYTTYGSEIDTEYDQNATSPLD